MKNVSKEIKKRKFKHDLVKLSKLSDLEDLVYNKDIQGLTSAINESSRMEADSVAYNVISDVHDNYKQLQNLLQGAEPAIESFEQELYDLGINPSEHYDFKQMSELVQEARNEVESAKDFFKAWNFEIY